ncbi:MAG: hypothetical protein RL518_781 [Pseudomonadota bacterium]
MSERAPATVVNQDMADGTTTTAGPLRSLPSQLPLG